MANSRRWGTTCAALSLVAVLWAACGGEVGADVADGGFTPAHGTDAAQGLPEGGEQDGAVDADGSMPDVDALDAAWFPEVGPLAAGDPAPAVCPPSGLPAPCDATLGGTGGLACEIEVHPYFAADPELLEGHNIELWSESDASLIDGRLVYVGSVEGCATYPWGWYFDSETAPTKVIVCPYACECSKQMPQVGFMWVSGCSRLNAPWLEPPPGAPPVCAKVRPPACETWSGGLGPGYPKCKNIGDELVANADPQQVNVVMHSWKSQTDAGLISFVPSPAHCAQVVEGWYFEPGSNPQRISICPTTCSCAKALPSTGFQVQVGCPRWSAL